MMTPRSIATNSIIFSDLNFAIASVTALLCQQYIQIRTVRSHLKIDSPKRVVTVGMRISRPFLVFFSTNHIDIFHKSEIQMIILKCFTCLNPNLFKSYDINQKYVHICYFVKKELKIYVSKVANLRPFLAIFGQLHRCLSQNWGLNGHFEVLNVSRFKLDQKTWYIIG